MFLDFTIGAFLNIEHPISSICLEDTTFTSFTAGSL
jgi:hypothetical protein